ncbi:hypothetical protein BDV06DRAFT_82931 [Aspergillus oleicola]
MPRLLGFGPSWKQQDEVEAANSDRGGASHVSSSTGASLLPRPVASLVSFFTQSTSLSLRIGTYFGGVVIDGARVTTLTGLELSRAVIEGILTRAGRDVAIRSNDSHGKVEAESILERSLAALHATITSASFFAAASFHLSSTTLSSTSNMSQALLSTLDAILGSTESSRAIAAIITLIRQEFRDQSAEVGSEKVGVGDLLVGTVGFVMLQRWGRKNTERHMRISGGVETIWDVVILDNGIRADVLEMHQIKPANSSPESKRNHSRRSSFVSPGTGDGEFDVVERPESAIDDPETPSIILPDRQQHIPDEELRMYIMKQLPRGCRASIKTDSVTAQTITVNVYDDDGGEITAPPGTMVVEDSYHDTRQAATREATGQQAPKHTIMFRTAFNRTQSADVRPPSRHLVGIREVNSDQDSQGSSRSVIALDDSTTSDAEPESTADNRNDESNPRNLENVQPKPTSSGLNVTNASQFPPRETRPPGVRRISDSKSTFGRGSLSKFAQRVKPTNGEKNDNPRRPSLRLPFQHSNTQLSSGTSTPRNKPKGASADRKPPTPGHTDKSTRQTKTGKQAAQLKLETSFAANRGTPRTLAQEHQLPGSPSTSRYSGPRPAGSRADYYKVHEKSQESYMMQTDTYSPSPELRSGSPTATRSHVRSSSSLSLTRSESETTVNIHHDQRPTSSPHRRSKSYTASIYSLATAGSDTSLVLAHRTKKSAYDHASTIQALNRDGLVPGIFPQRHFVRNIRRFCRFSSATYGSNALQVMGIPQAPKGPIRETIYSQEHNDFSHHTGLPASTILLSSYVDPAGGTNAAGETESGFPLVHYLFLDHESKAVVLALRGTWGFEDVLTDMTCAYDDLEWQGKNWKVHKGMHASAKHLLMGGGRRVMITIRAALEEFPDYGVVLCGHSLGGGVAGILATMISEPTTEVSSPVSFTTASRPRKLLANGITGEDPQSACYLPSGRPIHVYAFGPPAAMSPFLRRATRGLITTVVNGQDVVPCLSLGILHDMHTTSLAFKGNISEAKSHVRYRVWESLRQSIINKFYVNETPMMLNAGDGLGEDAWAWQTLQSLRDSMCAPKLVPPGEVFVVETMRVLQRSAFTSDMGEDGSPRLGKPATRVQLKLIRDVEARFSELRFGSGMFSDHNPARYEASLVALTRGILDD